MKRSRRVSKKLRSLKRSRSPKRSRRQTSRRRSLVRYRSTSQEDYPPELLGLSDTVLRDKLFQLGITVEGDRSALLESIMDNIQALKQVHERSVGTETPRLHLKSVQHGYTAPIEVANAPANKPQDARGVKFKFSISHQGAGAPPILLHGCLLVQTDATIDGIDADYDIWPHLDQMTPAELAYCWDETCRDTYFNYVADANGRPWGLAGHETNMKTDHPTSIPPMKNDPEINSLLSKRQGTWTHKDDYTVCLRVYPPTVVTGATQRQGNNNLFGGRMFRALFYAEDRVAYPEVICVTQPFPVRARATIDRARKQAREAAVAKGLNIGTVEHQDFTEQQLTSKEVPVYGRRPLGPTVPYAHNPLNVLANACGRADPMEIGAGHASDGS